jgi:hypothetical protein
MTAVNASVAVDRRRLPYKEEAPHEAGLLRMDEVVASLRPGAS